MAGRLVPAVLAGIIVIVLGGRAFLRGRRDVGGAGRTAGGALAVLLGSLVVTLYVPPTLDDFFPPGDDGTTTAAGPTPSPTVAGATPDAGPEPTPSPAEAAPSPSPTPAAEPSAPAAPPTPRRRSTRNTATATPAPPPDGTPPEVAPPAPPASPAAPEVPSPEPPPSPSPPAAAAAPPQVLTLAVSCTGLEPEMTRGDTFTMTYRIESPQAQRVGLGAALLDAEGDDHADGSGDRSSFELPAGTTTFSRPVAVHPDLERRRYEVVGGLWPEGEVGRSSAQPLREASCGSFEVVD